MADLRSSGIDKFVAANQPDIVFANNLIASKSKCETFSSPVHKVTSYWRLYLLFLLMLRSYLTLLGFLKMSGAC